MYNQLSESSTRARMRVFNCLRCVQSTEMYVAFKIHT